jgi:Tfp pilus assembly protein PilN
MKWVITIILLMPIWLYYDAWSHDEYLQSKLKVELKDGLKVATHDAALQVDPEALEEGRVVFLQETAEQAFLASIQRSYKLDTMLQPLPESIWQTSFRVVHFERVEDGEFPMYYNSGPPYYYGDTLNGPSIVTIVQVKQPRFYGISRDFNYTVGSSHEYMF